jgi:hypothetical protein
MIYVIGVDHKREQRPNSLNDDQRVMHLQNSIRQLIRNDNIVLIAEEWSEEAKRAWSVNTYAEDIAAEFGIEYLPCDPDSSERARLKMKSREQEAKDQGLNIFQIQENSDKERKVNEADAIREADAKREQYWLTTIVRKYPASGNVLLICGYGHADGFVKLAKQNDYEAIRL